jgi:prevent-host-death family protein
VKRVALREIKNDLSRFLQEADREEIVITRNRKPAGVLIGFASEDDWLDISSQTTRAFFAASSERATACGRGPRRQDRGCRVAAELE